MIKKDETTQEHKTKQPVRKVRSEAIILMTLGALLLFLITSMSISVIYRMLQPKTPTPPPVVQVEKDTHKHGLIVIDPGHGGFDAGCEAEGIYEKDMTLKIANYMGDYLEANDYQVVYTRESDVALGDYELEDLENRVAIGTQNDADYFVSLHLNFTEIMDERIYGYEVYANNEVDASLKLAESINTELGNLNYTDSRGVRDGSIMHVVYINPVPAVLVEVGFLDDEQDRAYITSEEGMKKIGEAIAKSVIANKK